MVWPIKAGRHLGEKSECGLHDRWDLEKKERDSSRGESVLVETLVAPIRSSA